VTVAAVVLAAGAGTRFSGLHHKLLAPLDGTTVVGFAVRHALEAGLDETIVVIGAAPLAGLLPSGCTLVEHREWRDGLASSLQAATTHASVRGHDAIVVGLGDQPFLDADAWSAVAASPWPITFATYDGRRGHPVRLAAEVWPLLPTLGERGAGAVADSHPDLVGEVPCPGRPVDIDTPEDLARWS
jgi:molybdenum cofactor cytidylyltransferase/nicotine blue oxidoreductase